MTPQPSSQQERLHELLADQALQGLAPPEQEELTCLLEAHPEEQTDSYLRAAAALDLALEPAFDEALPESLRAKLEAAASAFGAARTESSDTVPHDQQIPRALPWPGRTWPAWTAAAAGLALALLAWWPAIVGRTDPAALPLAEDRAVLLDKPETITFGWNANDQGVTGNVAWNSPRQEGYLHFHGLAVNDPRVQQYQLWIFPAEHAEPVNGGVFDVNRVEGDFIVRFAPERAVGRLAAFAVCEVPPGGEDAPDPDHVILDTPRWP